MSLKNKLSIIILTYNEEIHIRRCLNSLINFNVDIYIIDSGSTDATLKIAKEFGAEILFHSFTSQKEQIDWFLSEDLIPHKSWILRLDADEYLPEKSILDIKKSINSADESTGMFYLRLQRIFHGKHLKYGTLGDRYIPRLWRVGCAEFNNKNMDEKLQIIEGYKAYKKDIDFFDYSLISPIEFVIKHTKYAERQIGDIQNGVEVESSLIKKIYYSIPFEIASFLMFIYRYIFRLGFLDGRKGFWYHFLQCLFYRNLVGIESYSRKKESSVKNIKN